MVFTTDFTDFTDGLETRATLGIQTRFGAIPQLLATAGVDPRMPGLARLDGLPGLLANC